MMNSREQLIKELEEAKAKISEVEAKLKEIDKKKPWRSEYGGGYLFLSSDLEISGDVDIKNDTDTNRYLVGNYFYSRETAEKMAMRIKYMLKLQQLHDLYCPDFNTADENSYCYFVRYFNDDKFHALRSFSKSFGEDDIAFPDMETAKKVAGILNEEFHKNES